MTHVVEDFNYFRASKSIDITNDTSFSMLQEEDGSYGGWQLFGL